MARKMLGLAAALATAIGGMPAMAGEAKAALCRTTDDGEYPCRFRMTDDSGSFEISAPDRPSYILDVVDPGRAFGFVNFGDRNVALPGPYIRSRTEPACWENEGTGTEICVW